MILISSCSKIESLNDDIDFSFVGPDCALTSDQFITAFSTKNNNEFYDISFSAITQYLYGPAPDDFFELGVACKDLKKEEIW